MTLAITYDDTEELGRVRLSFSGYDAAADYALVERSTDQITWATVRGGDQVALTAGAGTLDDYEFSASVINYYRVTAVDVADPLWVSEGTAGIGNNASVTPGLPTCNTGDVMVLQASIRNSGTGTVNVPTGWTSLITFGNCLVAYRVKQAGDTAPTVTFAGGVAGADTLAGIFALRGVTVTGANIGTSLLNSSAQDIITPAVGYYGKDITTRYGWKQSVSTGFPTPGYTVTISMSGSGTGAAQTAAYVVRTVANTTITNETPVTISSSGGSAAISRGMVISFPKTPFTNQDTGNITPAVAYFRIKNPSRPSLNVRVTPLDTPTITRPARTGVFDVLGRNLPVTVSDVQSSRRFTMTIDVVGYSAMIDMDNRFALGEPMFLQAPNQPGQLPTLYFVAGDVSYVEDALGSSNYTFTIPVIEVAKPGSTVYGALYFWSDVVANYATWTAVVAANATWSALMSNISTNTVIVP